MRSTLAALLFAASFGAQAMCVGTPNFQSCTDSSGNSYTVNRFGNTTMMQGSNPNGSQWNQTSQTYGNTTFHNGTAANGNNWNGTTTSIGNTQIHQGTDSRGRPYQRTCGPFGCH
ncbi:hypothetical protein EZ313_22090 [Ramlibacter henchirensis]|uniref:Uncharacterized protein n=1 Tax=Ramlibacter henchirensis TaxID=204072 RepID=A0A4Z0BLX8_9BURK|nr:hypothetical protein [Ramlibacter henchirensis]TFY99257.1 hypothetical protein EZ313_22090 [Ramlibacter henchirensis]